MCANEREKRGSVSARLPRYPLITLTDNYSTARANCIFLYKKKYDNYSKKGTRRRGGGGVLMRSLKKGLFMEVRSLLMEPPVLMMNTVKAYIHFVNKVSRQSYYCTTM